MLARLKTKKVRTTAEVQADVERLEAEVEAAAAEHLRLLEGRERVLLNGTDEDLRTHDDAATSAKNQAERAALRRDHMRDDLDDALVAEEQARRREIYEAARAKRDDAVKALKEYDEAAERLAKIARRIAGGTFAASQANLELPDGVAPLESPEPDNSVPFRAVEYADERIQVAVDQAGRVVNGYNPDDPGIRFEWRSTGRKTMVNGASPAIPHRSFMLNLRIPSRELGKHHY